MLRTKNYLDFEIVGQATGSGIESLNRCLPGDTVLWSNEKCVLQKRAPHRYIVGILEVNSKYVYGHTSRGNKIYICYPYDKSYPPFRIGCSEKDTSKNKIIVFSFVDWPDYEKFPRGNLLQTLGSVGDLEAEKKGLLWRYGRPDLFSKEKQLGPFRAQSLESHRPLVEGQTINIDPEGCRDIDDVVSLRQIEDTKWELVISIADVASYIQEGGELDLLAKEKGQTLYQNGLAAIPMLPAALSEGELSLLPGKERMCMSLFCIWDTETKILYNFSFHQTRIVNTKTYTYDSIYKAKDFPVPVFEAIASHLHGSKTDDSHIWIEELMILYNKKVAETLLPYRVGLLRAHSAAKAEKVEGYMKIHPDLKFLAYESAKYVPTEEGQTHAHLGSIVYCHASSPLRRYADIVSQRALQKILCAQQVDPTAADLAEQLNTLQKSQKHHDRDLFFLETIIQKNFGTVEGIVVGKNVYVPAWKRMVSISAAASGPQGQQVKISYYANLEKPRWEERIVFRLDAEAANEN